MTKQNKKKNIKEKIKKIINVVCYVLSVAFILLMIIVGVQSCANKHSASSINKLAPRKSDNITIEPYYYHPINSGLFAYSVNSNNEFCDKFDLPTSSQMDDKFTYLINADFDIYDYANNTWYYNQKLTFEFLYTYVGESVDFDMWVVNKLYSDSVELLTYKGYQYDGNTTLVVEQNDYVLRSYQVIPLLNDFYTYNVGIDFTFNKAFNYNAPLGTNIDGVYGSGSFTFVGSDTAYIDYSLGIFFSNGQVFNQIRVWYMKTDAVDVYMSNQNGEVGIRRAPSGYYVYMFMEYNNTNTNSGLVVNTHDQIPYTTSGGGSAYYYANTSTWKNDGFREIAIFNDLSSSLKTSLNAFNNNNQNSVNGYVGSNTTENVFTLVGSAFSGLLPILSTYLLPGVTIGMLLFIPLVATLVLAIVSIIKK